MIQDFVIKKPILETQKIKQKARCSEKFITPPKNTKFYINNQPIDIPKRKNGSQSPKKNDKIFKIFDYNKKAKKTRKIRENKSQNNELNKTQILCSLIKKQKIENEKAQNIVQNNIVNFQIISSEKKIQINNNSTTKIEDHSTKKLLSLLKNKNNCFIENNPADFIFNNNEVKCDVKNSKNLKFPYLGRNFVLKSEACKNKILQCDGKKYSSPVVEYYKDINSQNFINSFFYKEKLNSKNLENIAINPSGSNENELLYDYKDFNGKIQIQRKITNDFINEEENSYSNLNELYNMENVEEKKPLDNPIKEISFNNIHNDSFINKKNYEKDEINENNNDEDKKQNVFPKYFNINNNIYNLYHINSMNITNQIPSQNILFNYYSNIMIISIITKNSIF